MLVKDTGQWIKFQYVILTVSIKMVDEHILHVPSLPTNISTYCERAKKSASS